MLTKEVANNKFEASGPKSLVNSSHEIDKYGFYYSIHILERFFERFVFNIKIRKISIISQKPRLQ